MKVVFFNIPATGHINPTFGVVSELVARGEEVLYVNALETQSLIERMGARFVPYPVSDDLTALMARASGGDIPGNALALAKIGASLLPFVLDLLRREQPNYVIFDSLAAWGKQGAQILGIPAAASISTFVLAPGYMPPLPISAIIRTAISALRVQIPYWRVARSARREFGAQPVGLFGSVMSTGALNIVYTSAALQPFVERLGPEYCFVGPSITVRPASTDFPFEQITRSPVVYISLGTINNQNVDFYRACFAAFADHPGQFILSAGQKTDLKQLEPIPANFIVRNFVPQLDVLQRANLFITHGGANSVHEGLYYNVPLVVIPQQFEQASVAARIVELGAGVALGGRPPFGQVTATELRAAVEQVLGARARYQQVAARLGESLRTAGGYVRAADELMRFGRGT
ncbi:MAG: glycosyl transferase [Anaerolineae bacterium]|nr:glycosyl transferase [Anaerolineae bacterium]